MDLGAMRVISRTARGGEEGLGRVRHEAGFFVGGAYDHKAQER